MKARASPGLGLRKKNAPCGARRSNPLRQGFDDVPVLLLGEDLHPLFLMEKMAPGFSPESRDWRYTMIMPDGSLFGVTQGEGSGRVKFCITCHETAGDENDHLFFVPEDYRVKIFSVQPE